MTYYITYCNTYLNKREEHIIFKKFTNKARKDKLQNRLQNKETNSQKILHKRTILPFFYSNEQAHAYAVIVTFLYLQNQTIETGS